MGLRVLLKQINCSLSVSIDFVLAKGVVIESFSGPGQDRKGSLKIRDLYRSIKGRKEQLEAIAIDNPSVTLYVTRNQTIVTFKDQTYSLFFLFISIQ